MFLNTHMESTLTQMNHMDMCWMHEVPCQTHLLVSKNVNVIFLFKEESLILKNQDNFALKENAKKKFSSCSDAKTGELCVKHFSTIVIAFTTTSNQDGYIVHCNHYVTQVTIQLG